MERERGMEKQKEGRGSEDREGVRGESSKCQKKEL